MTPYYDSIENRIMRLKHELKTVMDSFDPFDENIPYVENEDYLPLSLTTLEKGRTVLNTTNIAKNKGSKKMTKKCCIM